MIPHWKVINAIAEHYGKHEDDFDKDKEKLEQAREGKIKFTDLESNPDRIRLRMARNDSLKPFVLERINGIPDFQDTYIFEALIELAGSVVRITKRGNPVGTGFLIGEDVIMTNHHVIQDASDAEDMLAEFDFELDRQLVPKKSSCFRLNAGKFFLTSGLESIPSEPHSGLDFTLIGIDSTGTSGEQLFQKFKPAYLDGNLGKIVKGESCIIIQHPSGLPKKVVIKDTAFFSETGTRLVYESDTLPGSSGSMVVALGTCSIIALHHAGLPRTDDQNRILKRNGELADEFTPDDEIDWIGNEGIKISRIVNAIRDGVIPSSMESRRKNLLNKTETIGESLDESRVSDVPAAKGDQITDQTLNLNRPMNTTAVFDGVAEFLVTAVNNEQTVMLIQQTLKVRYNQQIRFSLAMPASAQEGNVELFYLQAPFKGDPNREAQELCQIPGIINAEPDIPLAINAGPSFISAERRSGVNESNLFIDDGFGTPNEEEFLKKYTIDHKSPYIVNNPDNFLDNRKWNMKATKFDKVLNEDIGIDPQKAGIRIVQFDTGFTNHPKVEGGFDLDNDHDFLNDTNDAADPGETGVLRQPGHGTRTGSLLIGNEFTAIKDNGNIGMLSKFDYKLVPFRIASSVILIKRQKELAAALDSAMQQGFDIITMSMGLPPTIATANMAKKAYNSGVIWCCAAGNQVQAVVAPAVYPGTIAVAASNPLDSDWPGSSRGDTVDITAPGQDVYVPIFISEKEPGFAYGDGTSYATPHVAAAAALWLAKYKSELNNPEYAGWKRVEAFRQALYDSARKNNRLPRKGFGKGMLDVAKLMEQKPKEPHELRNAYNGWNERAFFAFLQGTGEIAKTYWNRIHGLIFGARRGGQESILQETIPLSPTGVQLERALFTSRAGRFESAGVTSTEELLERYNLLTDKILSASQK
jgi:endonuclease G, mitochondrial